MPTKVGNAGHGQEAYDPKTGRYVKSGGGSAVSEEVSDASMVSKAGLLDFIKKKKEQAAKAAAEPYTIERAQKECDALLGKPGACMFRNGTDPEVLRQAVEALRDVKADFPEAIESFLMSYGNMAATPGKLEEKRKELTLSVKKHIDKILSPGSKYHDFLVNQAGMSEESINTCRILASSSVSRDIAKNALERKMKYGTGGITSSVLSSFDPDFVMVSFSYVKSNQGYYTEHDFASPTYKMMLTDEEKNLRLGSEKGWAYATYAHELGHVVTRYATYGKGRKSAMPKEMLELDRLTSLSTTKPKMTTMVGTEKESGNLYKVGVYEPYGSDKSAMAEAYRKDQVSQYALLNPAEALAEAFADYYGNGPEKCSEHNKKIMDLVKRIYDKMFKGGQNG